MNENELKSEPKRDQRIVFSKDTLTLSIEYYCDVHKEWKVLADVLKINDDGEIELEGYVPVNSVLATIDHLPLVKIKYGSFDRVMHWLASWMKRETTKRIKENR